MNITFLFGNGLDLGFGLESGYKSFTLILGRMQVMIIL